MTRNGMKDANKALQILARRFIGGQQLAFLGDLVRGPENQFFIDKLVELAGTVSAMPKSYETDGKGDDAVAYLHYFKHGMDFYITEKDVNPEQQQAFGYVSSYGEGELGYVCLPELFEQNVELDFYWTPKTLREIKARK